MVNNTALSSGSPSMFHNYTNGSSNGECAVVKLSHKKTTVINFLNLNYFIFSKVN